MTARRILDNHMGLATGGITSVLNAWGPQTAVQKADVSLMRSGRGIPKHCNISK